MTQPLPRYCGAFLWGFFLQRLFVVVLQRTFCEELCRRFFAENGTQGFYQGVANASR
ncbi:MAG TPA: hypothetical protein VL995_08710 [Cellvibrio sp.]|nr:hypothetical protein [Cellvibrio sp.]